MKLNYKRYILINCIFGIILGYIFLHPLSVFIINISSADMKKIKIIDLFSLTHLHMSIFFSLLGMFIGFLNGHFKYKLKEKNLDLANKNKLLADKKVLLTHLVNQKTSKIEGITNALVIAMENANLYNDSDTGNHIKRVSKYAALIAEHYGCEKDFVKRIRLYASLHDIGKVGLSDEILKKPGKYTQEEFKKMTEHVRIGGKMLEHPDLDTIAKNIALFHHEKWNSSGYIHGLKGNQIPLEARIVALAVVYDALGSKRVYKQAFPEKKIDKIIKESKGSHFDPELVDIFFKIKNEILNIKTQYK